MEDLETLRGRQRGIQHLIPLLDAIRGVAEVAWRRADRAAEPLQRYADEIQPALVSTLSALGPGLREQLLASRPGDQSIGLLVIGSERGLCGAFNEQLVSAALRTAQDLTAGGGEVRFLCLGSRAERALASAGQQPLYIHDLPSLTVPGYVLAEEIALDLLDLVDRNVFRRLIALGNTPTGRFQYRVVTSTMLPPDLPSPALPAPKVEVRPVHDVQALATHLLTEHFLISLYRHMLQSAVSEQLARMFAMRRAVDNARQLLDRLGIDFGAAQRQASTADLLEIVAGFELLRDQDSSE